MKRIILAYAGAESAPAIPWLLQRHAAEVVAVLVDLGRRRDLVEQRELALSLGAVRCHVVDARDEFARDYLLPALQAGAFAGPRPPVTPALARPIIANERTSPNSASRPPPLRRASAYRSSASP